MAFGDNLKASASMAIAQLKRMSGESVMLTGDNAGTARAVADSWGLNSFRTEVMPANKADVVAEVVRRVGRVAMVGDDINDAPALATADVGNAMGSGIDEAMQTAASRSCAAILRWWACHCHLAENIPQEPAESVLGIHLQRGQHSGCSIPSSLAQLWLSVQ